jgi:hypothetical protein
MVLDCDAVEATETVPASFVIDTVEIGPKCEADCDFLEAMASIRSCKDVALAKDCA